MAVTRIEAAPSLSPAWQRGRGPLSILPTLIFRDRQPWLAILVGWLLTIIGSMALGSIVAWLAPSNTGPDLGNTSGAMKLFLIAGFSPVVETLIMAGGLALLTRILTGWQAVLASALLWGIAHSLASPSWGAVIWWPFLIFSTLYVTWRPRGFWPAVALVASVHVLQNLFPALLIVFRH
jgi:membrane protease YdiL (CAAX protease family)